MANSFDELLKMMQKVIKDTTRFYVPRIGQVLKIVDPARKGRILVSIPAFNWMTETSGAWCYPKGKKNIITPNIGDYVIVEFIDGNMNLPIYSGLAQQMKDMFPNAYVNENSQVLFENRNKNVAIIYDETEEKLKIGDATESYVKGDTAKAELQKNIDALTELKNNFTAWTPVPNDGGASLKLILTTGFLTKLFADLTDILSDRIKGE